MKLKKIILGLAVVAVAGVNAWLANDVMSAKNDLSLLNLENIAEADERDFQENYRGLVVDVHFAGNCVSMTVYGPSGNMITADHCSGNPEAECVLSSCYVTMSADGYHY